MTLAGVPRTASATPSTGQAFALSFSSTHPLPEMSACATPPTTGAAISIDWAEATARSPEAAEPAIRWDAHTERFSFDARGIASYAVTAQRILVTPEPGADDRSVRAFLFGSAMGALLHLRGLAVLHGSAVALPDGGAAVFCGHSTAGKSTLAAALARRGHAVLADDIAALRFDADGQAWCLPGLARTKLWRDALDTLGLADQASQATRVMPELDKHMLPLAMVDRPAPLRRLYELQLQDDGELRFEAQSGMAKVNLLLLHTYRPEFVQAMGRQAALLRGAAALAPRLRVHRIARPRLRPTLSAIVDWLEDDWTR